ncbi:hypothetical protein K474DRAFT_1664966 [Panus rudis PR-1116 ss-1]|nr:hypothetical protein K474DRAFT_1664966 [Panus rudis PR-1116 ss-1]
MAQWLPLVPGCKRAVGKTLGSRVRIPQENHFDPQRFDQTLNPMTTRLSAHNAA